MSNAPTLGELALQTGVLKREDLDESLRYQRQNYLDGDFRRLGEILVDHARCSRAQVRELLARQGITVVECELCQTRYNALLYQSEGSCLRCGRGLHPSDEDADLTVEDAMAGGDPRAIRLLHEYRQRNPRIGKFEILGEVGRGGMGVIYKAWETELQRYVALKFLRPYDDISTEDRERFRMEARAVAQLRHENIVQAHAIEEVNGLVYMSMDFVQGVSMDMLANQGALSSVQIVSASAGIAKALHYAHGRGIVHRDVKPANVVLDKALKPYLVDFGIAKNTSESMSLTTDGEVLGSLAYMAPEYVSQGKAALDHRCDVYGLGVVLYETITRGKLPYGDPDDDMMIMRLVKDPPIPIEEVYPEIHPGLAKIVNRAIAKDRDTRYADAAAMGKALDDYVVASQTHGASARFRKSDNMYATASAFDAETEKHTPPKTKTKSKSRDLKTPESDGSQQAKPFLRALLGVVVLLLAAGWGLAVFKISTLKSSLREVRSQAGQAELKAGDALQKAGDAEEATAAYGRAIELLPKDPAPLHSRATLYESLGQTEKATADRQAAKLLEK
jgi:serine/threonine protein kinase